MEIHNGHPEKYTLLREQIDEIKCKFSLEQQAFNSQTYIDNERIQNLWVPIEDQNRFFLARQTVQSKKVEETP